MSLLSNVPKTTFGQLGRPLSLKVPNRPTLLSINIKVKNHKIYTSVVSPIFRPLRLRAIKTGFNLMILHFNICGKLSIIRCDKCLLSFYQLQLELYFYTRGFLVAKLLYNSLCLTFRPSVNL